MSISKKQQRIARVPDSLIKEISDRHSYGGVRSEPLRKANPDVDDPKPRPTLKHRLPPRRRAEEPYPEPRGKNRTPARG